jgi:hypothetical protein
VIRDGLNVCFEEDILYFVVKHLLGDVRGEALKEQVLKVPVCAERLQFDGVNMLQELVSALVEHA